MLEKSKLGVFLVLCFGADLEGNQKETTSVEGSPYFDTNLIVKRAHVDVLVSTCKPILKRLIRLPSTPTLRKLPSLSPTCAAIVIASGCLACSRRLGW